MYTSGHDAQGTWYTTPGFCSGEIGSFGCTKSCLNVLCGLKQVRISTGVRILRIDSETCQHKITVVWDQLKFWYTLKWIVNLKDVKQKLLDVVNEQINCVQKLPDKVNSQYSFTKLNHHLKEELGLCIDSPAHCLLSLSYYIPFRG